jgi:type II secretion system protein G
VRIGTRIAKGFTLIELMVVMVVIALLVTLAVPRYFGSVDKSKEAVLKSTLATTRDALDKFYGDNGVYPDSLAALVEKKYLRSLPWDPITESSDAWIIVPPEGDAKGAVYNIRSGADWNSLDGTPYRDW